MRSMTSGGSRFSAALTRGLSLLACAVALATRSDDARAEGCVPGQQVACSCGARSGSQVCADDGRRFGPCECDAASGAVVEDASAGEPTDAGTKRARGAVMVEGDGASSGSTLTLTSPAGRTTECQVLLVELPCALPGTGALTAEVREDDYTFETTVTPGPRTARLFVTRRAGAGLSLGFLIASGTLLAAGIPWFVAEENNDGIGGAAFAVPLAMTVAGAVMLPAGIVGLALRGKDGVEAMDGTATDLPPGDIPSPDDPVVVGLGVAPRLSPGGSIDGGAFFVSGAF